MDVKFNADTHQYTLDDKILISVTQLMQKHGLSVDYSAVDMEVLKKASEKGIVVHEELENYLLNDEVGFSWECEEFSAWYESIKDDVESIAVEQIVCNGSVAGTYDLLITYKDGTKILYDFKTESVKRATKWQWQLSLYDYIGNLGVNGICILWFNDKKMKVQPLEKVCQEQIEALLNAEKMGEYFTPQTDLVSSEVLEKLTAIESYLAELETIKKQADEESKALRKQLLEAMEKNGVKSFETPLLKVSYRASGSRMDIDRDKLKKDYEDVWKACQKTSVVKSSITIKVKEN